MKFLMCSMLVTAFGVLLAPCQAGGDPFYNSTWYAQPSPALAWSSQSVMRTDIGGSPFFATGSISSASPTYFVPGYGYTLRRGLQQSYLSDYGTIYFFGMIQPSMVPSGPYSPDNSFPRNFWPGSLHQPWYLPGSPGNFRPFLSPNRL